MALFFSPPAGCAGCHSGFNFSGNWRDTQGPPAGRVSRTTARAQADARTDAYATSRSPPPTCTTGASRPSRRCSVITPRLGARAGRHGPAPAARAHSCAASGLAPDRLSRQSDGRVLRSALRGTRVIAPPGAYEVPLRSFCLKHPRFHGLFLLSSLLQVAAARSSAYLLYAIVTPAARHPRLGGGAGVHPLPAA